MDAGKVLMKISYGFIAALVMVLLGLLVYEQWQVWRMPQKEESVPLAVVPVVTQTALAAGDGEEQLAAEVDNLRYQLEASEEELEMAREDLANDQDGLDKQEIIARNRKMRENPALMQMWNRDIENNLDISHGVLFQRLGLSDEKLQSFKTLYTDYEIEKHDILDVMHDPSLTDEERKEIIQTFEDQKAELGNQMKVLLEAEEYEIYDAYQERLDERDFVYGLDNTFISYLGISDEKAQELIDAMYEVRKKMEAGYDNDFFGAISPNPKEQMERTIKIYDGYNESARDVLSESQAGKFEIRINEQKEMMEMNPTFMAGGGDES